MPERKIKRALISVYDKTGIVDFARALITEFGIEIISTGGTAALLREKGMAVTLIEDITGFPEMMDGRVKTLHPKIHAAILADRDNPEHMRQLEQQGIEPIDMVVVNLYPFEKTIADPNCTFEQAIEMIDIGGPCLLRAAAKNHKHVIVCHDASTYVTILEALGKWNERRIRESTLLHCASGAFQATTIYDGEVQSWLSAQETDGPGPDRLLRLLNARKLRYGENPHQYAEYLSLHNDPRCNKLACEAVRADREMSFNNYLDANAAQDLSDELTRAGKDSPPQPGCVFVKHTNPCGTASESDPIEAYRKAYLGDPNAAMGGILAVNFCVDVSLAEAVMDSLSRWGRAAGAGAFFLEVWLAPSFDDEAIRIIRTSRKWGRNVRLLDTRGEDAVVGGTETDVKRIAGGVLLQERNVVGLNEDQWTVATKRTPTDSELADLRLAWLICKHTKSNAISICKNGMLIGNGAGQASRVMSCRIATWLATENGHAEKLPGSVAASDGFFPFADGPNLLIDAGVTAIIQPGGSKRDSETIAACDARDMAMICTGTRHFKH